MVSRGARATAVLFLVGAGRAGADEPSLTLDWTAPDGCPRRDDVATRVHTLLGQAPARAPRLQAAVRGVVTRTSTGVLLRLETRVARTTTSGAASADALAGERQLAGSTCDEVTSAGALVIALAIDPDSVAGADTGKAAAPEADPGAAPTGAASAVTPAVPQPDLEMPPPPEPAPAPANPRNGVRWSVAAHALMDAGSLPAPPTFGIRPAIGIARNELRAEAGVTYFFPRFGETDMGDGGGADVSLFVGNVRGCYRLFPGVVSVEGCAGAEAGALMASGEGFKRTTNAAAPWIAAEAGAGASVQVSPRVLFLLSAGVLLPFGRSSVRVASDDAGDGPFTQIHRPSPAAFRGSAGLSLAFP